MARYTLDKLSRTGSVSMKLDIVQAAVLVLMAFFQLLLPLIASAPGTGFPCLFANITDWAEVNASLGAAHIPDTPIDAFFFEPPEFYLFVFVDWMYTSCAAFFLCMGLYNTMRTSVNNPGKIAPGNNYPKELMNYTASNTSQLLIIVQAFCAAMVIFTAAFRVGAMVCLTAVMQTIVTLILAILVVTRGESLEKFEKRNFNLEIVNSYHYKVVSLYKVILMNVTQTQLAMTGLFASHTIGLMVSQHTSMTPIDGLTASFCFFIALTIVFAALTELYLARFVPALFGYYAGLILGMLISMLPLRKYSAIYANLATTQHQNLLQAVLGIFIGTVLFAAAMCGWRGYKFWLSNQHPRYKALARHIPPDDEGEEPIYDRVAN